MDAKESGSNIVERFRMARGDRAVVVIEGFHALKHALRFGADVLVAVAAGRPAIGTLERMAATHAPDLAGHFEALVRPLEEGAFARLSPRPPASGVMALARRPIAEADEVLAVTGVAPVVLLERPAHHGNIGAVVRVAAAAGAAGVLVTGPHDPWHPSSIRGGAGLQFALPVCRVEELPETDRPVVALDPEGERADGIALPDRAVVAFGSERRGLSDGLLERADHRIAIPMRAGVSSLNLATAVAITLYDGGPAGLRLPYPPSNL